MALTKYEKTHDILRLSTGPKRTADTLPNPVRRAISGGSVRPYSIDARLQLICKFRWHGDRVDHMFPLADYAEQGIVAAAGSDAPVTSADPLRGIYCAVTRKTASGTSVGASQKTSLLDAVRAATLNGAYASFEEGRKGSIEPGKLADLVVLDGSLLSSPLEDLISLKPALTLVGGEVVFKAGR